MPPKSQEGSSPATWLAEHVRIGCMWYLHYAWGEEAGKPFNRFQVSRGYTTVHVKPARWFEARSTIDLYEDDDGWELRLKYLHGRLALPVETPVVSDPFVEFGLVHTPFLGFEEHINRYRVQGSMLLERNGVLNSADLGLAVGALLGPKMTDAQRESTGAHRPGQWGSVSLGVYNGGGYHGAELNQDKVLMLRASLRPAGPWMPGLQATYYYVYGKGNSEAEPDWTLHDAYLSFQHPAFVLAGQLVYGRGAQCGDRLSADGRAEAYRGASGFAELELPWIDSALFFRYDWFDWRDTGQRDRFIAGAAYTFFRNCALLVDLDYARELDAETADSWAVKLSMRVELP